MLHSVLAGGQGDPKPSRRFYKLLITVGTGITAGLRKLTWQALFKSINQSFYSAILILEIHPIELKVE